MSFTASLAEIVAANSNGLLGDGGGRWLRCRLGEVAEVQNGYPFSSAQFDRSVGMPLIRIRDIANDTTEVFFSGEFDPAFVVHAGDLLVGMDGDFNAHLWRGPDGLLNQRVCRILPDQSRLDLRYLAYVLPGYLAAINAQTSAITVKHLSSKTIKDIPLPLPPVDEQRAIVEMLEEHLSVLNSGVSSLQRALGNTKRLRSAVLRAAVDGTLLAGGDKLLRVSGPEPWSPEVPRHWTFRTVDDLAELVEYGTSAKTGSDQGVPVLRMGNIVEGELDWGNLKYLPTDHADFPKLLLRAGDVLFNRTNSPELVGKTAVYRASDPEASFASYLLRVRLKPGMLPEFFSAFLNSSYGRSWIASVVTQQVGQANVNGTKLRALRVPCPPLDEQARILAAIEDCLGPLARLRGALALQCTRSTRLRQSILQAALSGNLSNAYAESL